MTRSLPENYREILIDLGEDPDREGLLDTPVRAAKATRLATSVRVRIGFTAARGAIMFICRLPCRWQAWCGSD